MAEVGIALTAGDCCALHPQAHIVYFDDILLGNGLPKAWPSRAGFKLGLRAEDGVVAADAAVKTVVVIVPGAAGVGPLRAFAPRDLKRDWRKLLLPLRIGFDDLWNRNFARRLPRVGKLDDGDSARIPGGFSRRDRKGRTPCRKGSDTTCAGRRDEERATIGPLRGLSFCLRKF